MKRRQRRPSHRNFGLRKLQRTIKEKVKYGKVRTIHQTTADEMQPAIRGSLIIMANELGLKIKLGKR